MNLKFNLQFFGGGGSTQTVRKRDPEPQELINLRTGLYNKLYPGLESFNTNSWQQAQDTANQAIEQRNNLLPQITNSLNQNSSIINKIINTTESGNIPSGLTNSLNASVNKELQGSMGNMLNGLAGRGVLNSSITGQGISRLGQQAADAFNKNYLTAYNSVLNGYNSALQGSQGNTQQLLSGISALGQMPSTAYENAYAQVMPAFNLWKAWQNSYDGREDYDTIVKQGK